MLSKCGGMHLWHLWFHFTPLLRQRECKTLKQQAQQLKGFRTEDFYFRTLAAAFLHIRIHLFTSFCIDAHVRMLLFDIF